MDGRSDRYLLAYSYTDVFTKYSFPYKPICVTYRHTCTCILCPCVHTGIPAYVHTLTHIHISTIPHIHIHITCMCLSRCIQPLPCMHLPMHPCIGFNAFVDLAELLSLSLSTGCMFLWSVRTSMMFSSLIMP